MTRSGLLSLVSLALLGVNVYAATGSGPVPAASNAYDFVIAGGGTAGLALAARLTENAAFQVLVLEAGPAPDSINQDEAVPGVDFFLEGSNLDWNFTTINQPTLNGRSFLYTRGKCLGGSSVMNFMAFNRGSSSVYDYWAAQNNTGWDWNSVYPYFQKSVQFTPPNTTNNSQITYDASYYSSTGGPVQISYGEYVQPIGTYWYPALQQMGVPQAVDFNGGNAIGVAHPTTTINPADESRSSSYTTFYAAAKARSNFHVLTGVMVEKILFNNTGAGLTPRAYGVQYKNITTGVVSTATANKEVILSTGAIQTPQLLMVSGIGPAATLKKYGITTIYANNGVGQRLQDHPSFYLNVEIPSSVPTIGMLLQNQTAFGNAWNQWATVHTGPLASMNGDILGFQRFSNASLTAWGGASLVNDGVNWPNVEYLILPAYDNPGTQYASPPNATGNYVTIVVALVSPTSLGSVTIASASMDAAPVIDVNYYATTIDQNIVIQGFKNALAAVETAAFAPIYLGRDKVVPAAAAVATDAEILTYIRNVTTTVWHGSGTAPMLPLASGGVVDSQLRVYGVNGLRVVDASIQPRITNQHVQAVVYMIAEKANAMLQAAYP